MKLLWLAAAAATLIWSNVAAANTRICVSVQQKSWYKPGSWAAAPAAPATPAPPGPQAPRGAKAQPGFEDIEPVQEPAFGGPVGGARTDVRRAGIPGPVDGGARPPQPAASAHEIDPTLHLRRMLEYEVTHEPGFAAVDERCE